MLYHVYELNHAALAPLRMASQWSQTLLHSPLNPLSRTVPGRTLSALLDVFESATRRYGKPEFGLNETHINGTPVAVTQKAVWRRPFCTLQHFQRDAAALAKQHGKRRPDPKVLIVAPMSGHYATLLRGTVEAMLPEHDVYITDWIDARMVPLYRGRFDLDDYIDYLIAMLQHLGPDCHVIAVCQPGPAALAATALMAQDKDPAQPASLIIMGSPIDPRLSPTLPNKLAEERSLQWFRDHVISLVPITHPGAFRRVYPGFIQLSSFLSMNQESHVDAQYRFFRSLITGDDDGENKHRAFYDEYLSVMDLTEEFYLQTIKDIFKEYLLPRSLFRHRGRLVKPECITGTALMTVEGEKDDISGIGQTQAAHNLCINIPSKRHVDYIQPGVGHYGVFNGSRFRAEIQPRMRDFIRAFPKRTR